MRSHFATIRLRLQQAVSAGPIASVDAEKLSLFKTLSDIAGATEELASEKARVTLLAPTNEVKS